MSGSDIKAKKHNRHKKTYAVIFIIFFIVLSVFCRSINEICETDTQKFIVPIIALCLF